MTLLFTLTSDLRDDGMLNLVKSGAVIAALIFAYCLGLTNGKRSEELKNANIKVATLTRSIQEFKAKQTSDALALSELRVAESRARDEYEWMRQQLSMLESRASKDNSGRDCLRFQRLAVEKEQLLNEAQRGLEFCYKNHK